MRAKFRRRLLSLRKCEHANAQRSKKGRACAWRGLIVSLDRTRTRGARAAPTRSAGGHPSRRRSRRRPKPLVSGRGFAIFAPPAWKSRPGCSRVRPNGQRKISFAAQGRPFVPQSSRAARRANRDAHGRRARITGEERARVSRNAPRYDDSRRRGTVAADDPLLKTAGTAASSSLSTRRARRDLSLYTLSQLARTARDARQPLTSNSGDARAEEERRSRNAASRSCETQAPSSRVCARRVAPPRASERPSRGGTHGRHDFRKQH